MSACVHEPSICPDCGGLTLTRWDDITDSVRSISLDGAPAVHGEVWIGTPPEPCDKTEEPRP
ncbi:hypothetical protein [Streptomyces sp. NPDC059949]|uniref:hypothetical protein n=1 Tax=Streptomyces sp. NPDC059949 TaxID=3347013 RepID=UPI00365BC166